MKMNPQAEVEQFVAFVVNKELFGVLIQAVEEIIVLPDKITPVPKAPYYFSGMINLRGEVISVIDLRRRFNLEKIAPTEQTRILIVSIQDIKVGMVVDAVNRVLSVNARDVRPPPAIMESGAVKYIYGSVQIDDAVMLMLDTDELIDPSELTLYKQHSQQQGKEQMGGTVQMSGWREERILIGFRLRHENYAIDINYVEEIIELPKITPVPEMSQIIEGIFHQRNRALPILRLSRRFRLPDSELNDDNSVLIVNQDGLVMGFIVDEITEVFRVVNDEIVPPPANISGRSAEQLEGIIKIKINEVMEVVMALNIDNILTDNEQNYLRELNDGLNDNVDDNSDDLYASEIISILKFRVRDEIFAIRVPEINEITVMQKMVQVPKTPPFVNGVINLRGDVITIIDLAKLFGNPPQGVTDTSRIVIVQTENSKAGFQVDQIRGIDHVPYNLFERPSGLIKGQYNQFIDGIGREPNRDEVIILMDINETLAQAELYDGDWGGNLLEAPQQLQITQQAG